MKFSIYRVSFREAKLFDVHWAELKNLNCQNVIGFIGFSKGRLL